MKKTLSIFLCMILCLGLLSACSDPVIDTDTDPSDNGQTATDPVDMYDQWQIHEEIYEEDTAVVEYISVVRLPDENTEARLNENLKEFLLWQWLYRAPDAEPDENYYMGTVTFTVIGDRFLSVIQQISVYNDEHPVNGSAGSAGEILNTKTFDFTTGEGVPELVFGGAAYTMGRAADVFTEVYPGTGDTAAKDKFHDFMQSHEYVETYALTESGLAVFFENDSGDDFYRFEAAYEDVPELLSGELTDALAKD